MKVVNIQFKDYPCSQQQGLMIDQIKDDDGLSDNQIFCQCALKILQKNSLSKLEQFKQFMGFQKLRILEDVFKWYIEHQGCMHMRKNKEKIDYLAHVYQQEINHKQQKLVQEANYRKYLKQSLAFFQEENDRKQAKITQLSGHVNQLAKMAKRKALTQLNQYGKQLLKSFKIQSSGFMTPQQIPFKNKTIPFFNKKRSSLAKKFFMTDGLTNRNSSSEVQLFLKANQTQTAFRLNKTQMSKRQQAKKLKKIQAHRDTSEEIRRLQEEKENCLHNMSERIILFQKKLAGIQQKLEGKKQRLGCMDEK